MADNKTSLGYKLYVGMEVKTRYTWKDRNLKRVITKLEFEKKTGSGMMVTMSPGNVCKCCGQGLDGSKEIREVDGDWCYPYGVDWSEHYSSI